VIDDAVKVDPNDLASKNGPGALKDALMGKLDDVNREKTEKILGGREARDLDTFLDVDTDNDPTCFIGRRWLGEGGSCFIIGQSGVGKSALCMQMAHQWALGLDFFGATAHRALKSLVIQAENDEGDVAEEVKGIMNNMKTIMKRAEVGEMVKVWTEDEAQGGRFIELVDALVQKYEPDLVWVDPILAFFAGNISDQAEVGAFFRGNLKPLARKHKFCWMFMHHTGKPKDMRGVRQTTADLAYAGIGSSDLTNFARSTILFRYINETNCEFAVTKRINRMGLIGNDGLQTNSVKLTHAAEGICWMRADPEAQIESVNALDHAAFVIGLRSDDGDDDAWLSKDTVVENLRDKHGWSQKDCRALVRKYIEKKIDPLIEEVENMEEVLVADLLLVRKERGRPKFKLAELQPEAVQSEIGNESK